MKIALIVPGGVDRSGTERVIPCLLWFIERVAREAELHVFAMRQEPQPARYQLLGADVHNIGAKPRRVRAVYEILREHSRAPFDVIHAVWSAPEGVIAGIAGKRLDIPVLLSIAGGDLASLPEIDYGLLRTARGRMWLRYAARRAARVTTPSDFMLRKAEAIGIRAGVLTFGVALDRWPALDPRPREPGASANLLHIGSLNRVKDQRTLLRATRMLVDAGLNFHLDIVGADTLNGEVQRFAESLQLEEFVTFHGFNPQSQLRPFFDHAHVLLVTSLHEGDPIAMLEAAVAGVPTVGTAVGHIADWAPDAAIAVDVGDAETLAQRTLELLHDDERRLLLARNAQQRALAIDADYGAERFLAMYREMMERKK